MLQVYMVLHTHASVALTAEHGVMCGMCCVL